MWCGLHSLLAADQVQIDGEYSRQTSTNVNSERSVPGVGLFLSPHRPNCFTLLNYTGDGKMCDCQAFVSKTKHFQMVIFSATLQTSPGAHSASYTACTGSFPGVKRGADYPPWSSADVKEIVELYLYSRSVRSWHVTGWTSPLPVFTRCNTETRYV